MIFLTLMKACRTFRREAFFFSCSMNVNKQPRSINTLLRGCVICSVLYPEMLFLLTLKGTVCVCVCVRAKLCEYSFSS